VDRTPLPAALSLIRGSGATASSSSYRMMLHSDHIRLPSVALGTTQIDAPARHPFCEDP